MKKTLNFFYEINSCLNFGENPFLPNESPGMSQIAITIRQRTLDNRTLLAVKNLSGQSLLQVTEHIRNGSPVFQALLFGNDHDEIADVLLKIVHALQIGQVKFNIYELEEDEVTDEEKHQHYIISVETLKNILAR